MSKEITKKFDTKVSINMFTAILWGKDIIRESSICNNILTTKYGVKKLTQASLVEIIFLKYVVILFLLYLLNTFTLHEDSLLGFGLSGVLYVVGFWIKRSYSHQTMMIFLSILFIMAVLYGGYNLSRVFDGYEGAFNFGFVVNYIFKGLLVIYFLHNMYVDILTKGYEGYYKIEDNLFRYAKVGVNNKLDLSYKYSFFKWVVLVFSVLMLNVSGAQIMKDYVVNELTIEKMKEATENNNKANAINYDKWTLDRLDKEVLSVGLSPLHRMSVSGIEKYLYINVVKGTQFGQLELNAKKGNAFGLSYVLSDGVIDGTVITYEKDTAMKVKAFIKDEYWHFVKGNKIFKIISSKAVK